MEPTEYIWQNGEFVKWDDATVHVLTHGLHYGTGVFEGVRCYETDKGPAIFRGENCVLVSLRSGVRANWRVRAHTGTARTFVRLHTRGSTKSVFRTPACT